MHQVSLKAKKREKTGKESNKKVRRDGMVPGVVNGKNTESMLVMVDAREFKKAMTTSAGSRVILNLEVEDNGKSETVTTMVIEIQKDIYQKIYHHVDFQRISLDEKVHADIPINLVGESKGVKLGGVMDHAMWSVRIEALPLDMPNKIVVDVTNLGEGDRIQVKDLDLGDKVTVLEDPNETIAIVHPPRVAETGETAAVGAPAQAGAAG